MLCIQLYCIAGNFEGENFRKFYGFVAIHESFLAKFGGMTSFGAAQVSNLQKFSPRKSYFSPIRESYLPRKFPLYGIVSLI